MSRQPSVALKVIFTITNEQYLQALTDEGSEAVIIAAIDCDQETCVVVKANSMASIMFGRPLDEIVGSSLLKLIPPRFRREHLKQILLHSSNKRASQSTIENTVHKVMGWNESRAEEFPVSIDIGYPVFEEQQFVVAKVRNDSERVALRDELIREKQRLQEERDRAERSLELREELDQLRQVQTQTFEAQSSSAEDIKASIRKIANRAKVFGPIALAVLGLLSDWGQGKIEEIDRSWQAKAPTEVSATEASLRSLPILFNRQALITDALTEYRGDAALAIFGHYSLNASKEIDAGSTGQIDLQVKRSDVELASKGVWSLNEQPFRARAQRHLEASCYTIDSANSALGSVAYQVSCPVYLPDKSTIGFVALEYRHSYEEKQQVTQRTKELAIAVQEILNSTTNLGINHADRRS